MFNGWKRTLSRAVESSTEALAPRPSKMLCPMCIQWVDAFPVEEAADGSMVPQCPECSSTVPQDYVDAYPQFPPVSFSIIGFRSHGKSVFLGSLFHDLDHACVAHSPKEWPDFSYFAPDEATMRHVREIKEQLEEGHLPDATDQAFFRPAILQMRNVPKFGSCQLLSYDTSGELLQDVSTLKSHHVGYISRVPTILLLVSWKQTEATERAPHGLNELLTIYQQAMRSLGGDLSQQNLLVVLTKGDRLVNEAGLPASVREFLLPSAGAAARAVHEAGDEEHLERLDEMSEDIEEWFERHPKFSAFAREARDKFRRVEYCAATATGAEPETVKTKTANGQDVEVKRLAHDLAPRGVLSTLLWAVRLQRPDPEADRKRQTRVGAASKLLQEERFRSYCGAHGLEAERQRALRKLERGRIQAANRLLETIQTSHKHSSPIS